MSRPGSTINALADVQHAALHLSEEGRDHHDDGSFHLDDSIESVQHLIADRLGASAALLAAGLGSFADAGSESPAALSN